MIDILRFLWHLRDTRYRLSYLRNENIYESHGKQTFELINTQFFVDTHTHAAAEATRIMVAC
jgi:hypothetical protein